MSEGREPAPIMRYDKARIEIFEREGHVSLSVPIPPDGKQCGLMFEPAMAREIGQGLIELADRIQHKSN